jgi:Cu2+-exporting ATPase
MPRGNGGAGDRFCCRGCETAYELIHSCGLDAFYKLRDSSGASPAEVRGGRRGYSDFDDPTFLNLYCVRLDDGTVRTDLLLEGLHCAACVWLVEKLPRVVPGVIEARLDMRRACVAVRFDPSQAKLSRIARGLDSLGYPPHPARRAAVRDARRAEDRRMLVRVAVAGACAGNIMLLFFALYAGMFEGIERENEQLFRWASMVLNTICLAWPGQVFARSALAALRTRTINLDVPIALGLYLGGAWGIWKTIAGAGDLYFDSISALIFFLLIGRMIQMRQHRFAADALELLFNIGPTSARRVGEDGTVHDVATVSLVPGDVVEVRAGETAPSDGRILQGSSSFDQSMLTGESHPCRLDVGEEVAAGTVNISSPIRMRVEATGEATRIGRLLRMVEEAGQRRAAIVRLADRWGAWLLWALLALAAVTLAIWWPSSPAVAIDRAAALLIATCPCGLGLATPLAMTVAMGRAARSGILVKGGDVFEALARTRGLIILDKTGTITRGELAIVRWHGDDAVQMEAASLERSSSHPIARALSRCLPDEKSETILWEDVNETPGKGIRGRVLSAGGLSQRQVAVGSERYMSDIGTEVASELRGVAENCATRGNTAVFVAVDGNARAVVEMGDPVRVDAAESIERLKRMGWNVRMLSGDRPDVARAVARSVGLEEGSALGGASPEDKLAIVRQEAKSQTVVMVGDGVNDAAALAAATVGIAVRGGAEASLAAADVSLKEEGLAPVVELMEASRRVLRSIHMTIATSLFYNIVAASLAMAGLISPLLAAIIMPASSLTVVAICLRSRAFGKRADERRNCASAEPNQRSHDREPLAIGRAREVAT